MTPNGAQKITVGHVNVEPIPSQQSAAITEIIRHHETFNELKGSVAQLHRPAVVNYQWSLITLCETTGM
jgi:hypothetical protein